MFKIKYAELLETGYMLDCEMLSQEPRVAVIEKLQEKINLYAFMLGLM